MLFGDLLKDSDHCSQKVGMTPLPFSPFGIQTSLSYMELGHWIVTPLAKTKTSQQAEVLFIEIFLQPVLSFSSTHPPVPLMKPCLGVAME